MALPSNSMSNRPQRGRLTIPLFNFDVRWPSINTPATSDRHPIDTTADTMLSSTRRQHADSQLNPTATPFVPKFITRLIRLHPSHNNASGDPRIEYGDIFDKIDSATICQAFKFVDFPQTFVDERSGRTMMPVEVLASIRDRSRGLDDRLREQWRSGKEPKEALHAELPSAIMLYQIEKDSADAAKPRTQRYLPLRPTLTADKQPTFAALRLVRAVKADLDTTCQEETHQVRTTPWPATIIPVEIFELITSHLCRQDVKAMRLVNHEFEEKIAHCLFQTSVVPFNTELYDMVDEDHKQMAVQYQAYAERLRQHPAVELDDMTTTSNTLLWPDNREDVDGKIYKGHGLKVFQGFGRHIRRFGLSFEVSEDFLAQPPVKHELDHVQAYFGDYNWPTQFYARFARLAGLERIADETSRMKAAFATLEVVQELALSVDSGFGWMNGPDKSAYTQICKTSTPVFRSDANNEDAKKFWRALKLSYRACVDHAIPFAEHNIAVSPLRKHVNQLPGLRDTRYANTATWPSVVASRDDKLLRGSMGADSGIVYLTPDFPGSTDDWCADIVNPNNLRKKQLEWLRETEWAQRAFLESYVLALIENPPVFSNITTLSLVKISSGLLDRFSHSQFWDTLTNVSNVTLKISVDWRRLERDDAGVVEAHQESPTVAFNELLNLITTHIQVKASIKKLHLGYTDGGEHAEGMFARNQHIMPAPLTTINDCQPSSVQLQVNFQHVEDFTLSNCWVAPNVLQAFVHDHAFSALKRLCLQSVSLTIHPSLHAMKQMFYMAPNAAWGAGLDARTATIEYTIPGAMSLSDFRPAPRAGADEALRATLRRPIDLWTIEHRADSWQVVLNNIAPGENFVCFRDPLDRSWIPGNPHVATTNLRTLTLQSVGYAAVQSQRFEEYQRVDTYGNLSPWFSIRQRLLLPAMMQIRYDSFANIVQLVVPAERQALAYAWGLRHGWDDREASEAVTFDGKQPGGTGRFSGTIQRLRI